VMFLDVAMGTKTNGVAGGIGLLGVVPGIEYTLDGNRFNASVDFELDEASQSCENIRGLTGAYGLTGDFGNVNGVAVSTDRGVSYRHIDAKVNTSTRYGSFPSPKVWYLSAGQWPDQQKGSQRNGLMHISERLSIERVLATDGTGRVTHRVHKRLHDPTKPRVTKFQDNNTYIAAVAKTTDGGNTWQTVFYDTSFYFNGISCPSENHCFAVGEADDGAKPGARILHTADGGKTWEVQLYNANPAYSLMAISMIDENTGWAAGGELDAHFKGHFWFTNDAGKTWNLNTLAGVYGTDMSFVGTASSYKGWATAFTWDDQSSVLAYS